MHNAYFKFTSKSILNAIRLYKLTIRYIDNENKNASLQYADKESRHLGSKRLDHKLVGIKTGLTRLKQELNNFQNNSSKDDSHKDYFANDKEKIKDSK